MTAGPITLCGAFLLAVAANSLWQTPLLAAAAWTGLQVARNPSASTRCVLWTAAFIASAVLPVVTTISHFLWLSGSIGEHFDLRLAQHVGSSRGIVPFTTIGMLIIPAYGGLAAGIFWIAAVCSQTYRFVRSIARLSYEKSNALPLDISVRQRLGEFNRAARGWRKVRLGTADIDVPVAAGIFDSLILLPSALLRRLDDQEIDRICVHELAHLRRGDDWSIVLEYCIATLFCFNPLLRFIIRKIEIDREIACDDWVLRSEATAEAYAANLIHFAEAASFERAGTILFSQFAGRKPISLRIENLLRAGRNASTRIAPLPFLLAVAPLAGFFAFALVSSPVHFIAAASEITSDSKQSKNPGAWEFVGAEAARADAIGGKLIIRADAILSTTCDEAIIVHDEAQGEDSYNLLGRQKPRPGRYCPAPSARYSARQRFSDSGASMVLLRTSSGVLVLPVQR